MEDTDWGRTAADPKAGAAEGGEHGPAPTLTCRPGDFNSAKPVASPKSGVPAAASRGSVKWRGLRSAAAAAECGDGSAALGAAGGQGLRWFGGHIVGQGDAHGGA